MRVAILEDNPVYRAGLVRFLALTGAELTCEATRGDELLHHLREVAPSHRPDVALLDIAIGDRDDEGLVTALDIGHRYPAMGILLLSAHAEAGYAERLFEAGSARRGYMLKDNLGRVADLEEALERLHRGHTYTDPVVIDKLVQLRQSSRLAEKLTAREQTVVSMLAQGASNAAIAAALNTTPGSVEGTISAVYRKMGLPDTPEYNRRVLIALRWLRAGN